MKKNELLRPCYLQEAAQNRMKELLEAKKILTEEQNRNSLKCYGKSLRVVENNHSYAYYIRTTGYDSKGIYLSAGNKDLADCLATVEYTKKCLAEIEKEIASLGKFLKTYTDEAISLIFKKLPKGKQKLVTPIILPDEEYSEQWKSAVYEGKTFSEDSPQFYTSQGIRVRSKSEVILADTLTRLKVPYRYEFPVKIEKTECRHQNTRNDHNIIFHPDFYCLNVRTRQEFIWEHFGMMDTLEYSVNATEKINLYRKNGWFEGENLIITYETSENPLNTKEIEMLIKKYLL